jgi:hypothetical protein
MSQLEASGMTACMNELSMRSDLCASVDVSQHFVHAHQRLDLSLDNSMCSFSHPLLR